MTDLFTWPAVVLVALSIPWVFFRKTPTLVLGLVLLTPGPIWLLKVE